MRCGRDWIVAVRGQIKRRAGRERGCYSEGLGMRMRERGWQRTVKKENYRIIQKKSLG
jgi:hypothetical protein